MRALSLVVALTSLGGGVAPQSDSIDCNPWQTCRELAIAAAERGDFETFHTVAWRVVQTGPRNDPELMYLLAKAQSLGGRPHDALVMLRRLAERGFARPEVETLEDFRRVRNLPEWPDTLEVLRRAAAAPGVQQAPSALAGASSNAKPISPSRDPAGSTGAGPRVSPEPAAVNAEEGLALPGAVGTPAAMAYDAVSGRMVIADSSSDTLKVLSELSTNAVDLVSRGWAGRYRTTAIAIDGRRGDLWVVGSDASTGQSESVLHRVQLISGRLRYSVSLPAGSGAARFGAIALSANNAFVLDVEGRRIFELEQGGKTLQLRMTVTVTEPVSLAMAGDDVAFLSHASGIVRLDLVRRRSATLTAAKGVDVRGLQWIAHDEGSLLGIQRRSDGTLAAVRIRLDGRGGRATSLEIVGPAAAPAATVMNGVFYYLENRGGTRVMRAIPVR